METSFADIILRKIKTMPGVDVSTIQNQPVPSTSDSITETTKSRQRKIPNFIFGTGKVLNPTKPKVQVIHKATVPKNTASVNSISNTRPKDSHSDNDTIERYKKFIDNLIKKKNENKRRTIAEHPEYNRDTNPYPTFGKKYDGEKAVISLTSWKARINTVYITLDSLIRKCPGFHIVLVLSEEEFPKMCEELPESLMSLVDTKKIELLFVYKNYKSFKKVLFAMDKYRDVPIISADDDCMYTSNYAKYLYDKWVDNKTAFASCWGRKTKNTFHLAGFGTLHPPFFYGVDGLKKLNKTIISTNDDDAYYTAFRIKKNFDNCICLNTEPHLTKNVINNYAIIQNEVSPLSKKYLTKKFPLDIILKEIV